MDDERIKKAVLAAIEKSVDAHDLAEVVRTFARGPRPTLPETLHDAPTPGARKLLTRIVLGEILDDSILAARPQDRTFPLRLFFGELSRLLAMDADEPAMVAASDAAFVSPGEARKLALAMGLGRHAWALVLDEPTNHLDLPTIERLERALESYPGCIVLVTHDDAFAHAVTNRNLRVAGGEVM